jgi:hypothetical protein
MLPAARAVLDVVDRLIEERTVVGGDLSRFVSA